mmetsp:Transcript_115615/g.332001  ORF Transcript_115615/g.332001 Transcript_115615/m.332001 type:complete len:246 (+) Transcript_115615:325-1062(+)
MLRGLWLRAPAPQSRQLRSGGQCSRIGSGLPRARARSPVSFADASSWSFPRARLGALPLLLGGRPGAPGADAPRLGDRDGRRERNLRAAPLGWILRQHAHNEPLKIGVQEPEHGELRHFEAGERLVAHRSPHLCGQVPRRQAPDRVNDDRQRILAGAERQKDHAGGPDVVFGARGRAVDDLGRLPQRLADTPRLRLLRPPWLAAIQLRNLLARNAGAAQPGHKHLALRVQDVLGRQRPMDEARVL